MKRTSHLASILLLLILLVGCSPINLAGVTSSPPPMATHTPVPSQTPLPSNTPVPSLTATRMPAPLSISPTPTWVPTLPAITPSPTLDAALSAELLEVMDAIEREIEELRGLDETLPITRTLMNRQELRAYFERQFAEDYPPEEVQADLQVLAAFDFVPEDFDLQGLLLDLYSSQVLGLYDDEEDTFYIVSEGDFDLVDQITFAHEYTHGLQDQNFGLDTFMDEDLWNDDEILARLSLVEGDASLAMSEYLMAHLFELSDEDLKSLLEMDGTGSQEALDAAPSIIRETIEFPYIYGLEFVSVLQENGWQAVDAAFAEPPQSTEQILHPEKYLSRDSPQIIALPPLTDTLGVGWRLVEVETLGEFQTGLYLAQQVDEATADLASEGWDGDQYAVYVQDGAAVLVFATLWDSPGDREEFVNAYTQYAEGKYGEAATRAGESELWWETPSQSAVLSWDGDGALIVLGPDAAMVQKVLNVVRQKR